jgi:small conductance mechanosensitive channel
MDFSINGMGAMIGVYSLKLLGALAIFVLGRWAVLTGAAICKTAMLKSRIDQTLASFASNVLYFLGLTFVVIAALSQLGIQTTSLAAVLGAAGLAIALSLQSSLGNIASGVMIIGTHPFKIGDMVEIAGKTGRVTEVNVFSTELHTSDNKRMIIPNAKITSDIIVNHTL